MSLDIILVSATMDVISGAVIISGITALARVLTTTDSPKIQSCIDGYIFTNERNNYEYVQCMKGQFPDKFADAYKRKLEADSMLKEESQ